MPIVAVTHASVLTNLPQKVPKGFKNVHTYSSDSDVVVLFISHMPLRTSEMVQILGTGVSKQHLRLQCIFDEECMPYLGVTPQDIFRQRARKPGSMFL